MSDQWYYAKGRERVPATEDQLKQLARQGLITGADMVFPPGATKWVPANSFPGLFDNPKAPPDLPPIPEKAPSPLSALGSKFLKLVLSDDWREFLVQAWAAWKSVRLWGRIVVLAAVVAVLAVTIWSWFARGSSGGGTDVWSRIWDSGLITGTVGLVFLFLKKKLESPQKGGAAPAGGEAAAAAPVEEGSPFLGLSVQQWLGVLVALFIPVLLASLGSSFLIGSQVHLWITGPLLCVLGLAIAILSVMYGKARNDAALTAIGAIVGISAPLFYSLTCINAPWVLLFYTLLVILPSLHLLTVVARGMPRFRISLPLMAGIGVIGATLALGIFALPRGEAGGTDQADKLVGTWVQTGGGSAFRQPTLTFTKGKTVSWGEAGDAEWVAQYAFDGQTLTISDGHWNKVAYHLDLSSETAMLLGEAQESTPFGGFSVLKGRWQKGQASGDPGKDGYKGGPSPPPIGLKDPPKDKGEKPNLNSPLASKLVGTWRVTQGKSKGALIEFTKGGKALLTYPAKSDDDSVTGTYTFTSDAVIRLDEAGALAFDSGWQVEIEFDGDDAMILVNQGNPYGGFGPLSGRLARSK